MNEERIELKGEDHYVNITEDQLLIVELRMKINGLRDTIRLANACSESYEGVGLLYWMEQCGDDDTKAYTTIEEILNYEM